MKTLFRMMALFLMLFSFAACSDDNEVVVPTLEVTPANLNGTWKMVEWNGESQKDIYCYITFNRKNRTYEMYDNANSMYAKRTTGNFYIQVDRQLGYIIHGTYDFGKGNWDNYYIVSNLLATGSMTWTVVGDPTDVQKFERCDKVPAEIIEEARKSEE